MSVRQIVPFGGLRPVQGRTHPIVEYPLELAGKPRARVAFVPTATGDATETLVNMYARFPAERTERIHLALFNRTIEDIEEYVLRQDIIWIGGGNTANLLAVWRVHGVDRALRTAWENGVVLTGGSAGSLCWFEADGFPAGYAIDDDAAIRFVGQDLADVVTARTGASAYRVQRGPTGVVEMKLEARLLPGSAP